jgi:hypothetical protein
MSTVSSWGFCEANKPRSSVSLVYKVSFDVVLLKEEDASPSFTSPHLLMENAA